MINPLRQAFDLYPSSSSTDRVRRYYSLLGEILVLVSEYLHSIENDISNEEIETIEYLIDFYTEYAGIYKKLTATYEHNEQDFKDFQSINNEATVQGIKTAIYYTQEDIQYFQQYYSGLSKEEKTRRYENVEVILKFNSYIQMELDVKIIIIEDIYIKPKPRRYK